MTRHAAKRPQPILVRANIVAALSVLSALLVFLDGGHVSEWLDVHADLIAGLILAAGPAVTALLARRHVTPVDDPRARDGSELKKPEEPAGDVLEALAAARTVYDEG